jgi:hypothetical protein
LQNKENWLRSFQIPYDPHPHTLLVGQQQNPLRNKQQDFSGEVSNQQNKNNLAIPSCFEAVPTGFEPAIYEAILPLQIGLPKTKKGPKQA